ncbi:MAG TPA: DUF2520 domain-containing protein [Candidatus Polarisedimenticolaceae bacterium]|nr:DUF2520 domain-containing protein [Candidatus Polarisedimenticolaceae bacterium]
MSAPPRTAVVGAGRLARALAPALVAAGHGPVRVLSPGGRSARALARGRRGISASPLTETLPDHVRLVLLAVPDDRIAETARALAASGVSWRRRVVLHTSGALGVSPLAPLAQRGASVGVLHPLHVFGPSGGAAPKGTLCRVEGRRAARLARDLGWVPVAVPRPALYHAAASLASNDVVALLDLAAAALVRAGMPRARAWKGALALAEGALAQARKGGIPAALTGPASRGDARTVGRQVRALRRFPLASLAHGTLSMQLVQLAVSLGRLDPAGRKSVERALAPVARSRT